MPIVDIEIVEAAIERRLTQALADGIGQAFEAPPGKVWVRVRNLPATHYAENDTSAPAPVFVTITAAVVPEGKAMKDRIVRIVEEVARATGRPKETVHVEFRPAAKGRIAFGGKLVE